MAASLRHLAGRITKGQKGFTLIEMIVVVGIIAVLAAVIVPNIGKFIGSGEAGAKSAEQESVETAMAAMMADHATQQVLASTAANANWTALPLSNPLDPGAVPLYNTANPELSYMYEEFTIYCYTWDAYGKILVQTEATTPANGTTAPVC